MPSTVDSSLSLPPPTRARYIVLAYLCAMAFILYLDRLCMGQAAPAIQDELGLSYTQLSFVQMAFTLAYGIFEVPTGRWGDRFGSRRVLTRIVLWWSLFTALTGLVWRFRLDSGYVVWITSERFIPLVFDSFVLLMLIRFLFGAGEAGAYPNAARVLSRWFADHERGRVQGIMLFGAQAGGALAPFVVAQLSHALDNWRVTFFVFGLIGAVWAVFFYLWFRDDPVQHPSVNDAERQLIGPSRQQPHSEPIPWRAVLKHPSMWLLGAIMILASFVSYMIFSWYPTYLQHGRDVDPRLAGTLTSLVLGAGAVGTLAGGFVANFLTTHSSQRQRHRRLVCFFSYVAAAGFFFVSLFMESAVLSAWCVAGAAFAMFSYQAHWWSCITELAGKHVGALFGLLNGMGVVGAMSSQYFVGAFADWRGDLGYTGREQWDPAFYPYAAALSLTALCWLGVDSSKPVATNEHEIS